MSADLAQEYTILYLPASSMEWAGILAQFTMHYAGKEGRAYATWAAERLLRGTRRGDGLVALTDGALAGIMLYELEDNTADITFPWTTRPSATLAAALAEATVKVIQEEYADVRYIRVERQLIPGEANDLGMREAGFICHWRQRMSLELYRWRSASEEPSGYRIARWALADLDAAGRVVFLANEGTLDALLYAPFFGDSPEQCRKGLLSILAGRYGAIHPKATLSAFYNDQLVGVNLVIDEGGGLASVVEISVDPAHQGKGLGRALMVRSLRALQHENMERVELAVTRENSRACQLYESLGFTISGDFPVCVWPR